MRGSPLIIGCDLRKADDDAMAILKNKMLIKINQDEAYRQPFRVNGDRHINKNRKGDEPLYEYYPVDEPILVRFLANGNSERNSTYEKTHKQRLSRVILYGLSL